MAPNDNTPVLPGGYRAEQLIGRGPFGQIWRAVAPSGDLVLVEIRYRLDNEERLPMEGEFNVWKRLNHPFLQKMIACYSEEERLYLIMELADDSLRGHLELCKAKGMSAIPILELLPYFRESAEALDYLHSQNLLHGNLKPANILLVGKHVRLTGFDLFQHREPVRVGGTPLYMAPEVWRGQRSKFSDQYSLACTYAELRLGHRVFASRDLAGVMFDHLQNTPNLEPLSNAEQRVLLKALAKNTDERYPHCLDLIEELEGALGLPFSDPQEGAFLAALAEDPDDDTTRLVYADWLDERGDARGAVLRLEVQLASLSLTDPRFTSLRRRLQALAFPLHRGWLSRIISYRQSKIPNWETTLFEQEKQIPPVKKWWQFWRT